MSTALAGKDIAGEVLFLSRELKTPVIAATFATLGDQAREQGWSHENTSLPSWAARSPPGPRTAPK